MKSTFAPVSKYSVIFCLLILRLEHGMPEVSIVETVKVTEWCRFCDVVLRVCGSFCMCKTFRVRFSYWQLQTPGLLSSTFPTDRENGNRVRIVKDALFSYSQPTPFYTNAQLAGLSEDVISLILDLEPEEVKNNRLFVEFVSGKLCRSTQLPLCHRYGGHQFGIWAGQLGDGRAHLLGDYVSCTDGSRWELQLKGSGKTPYSRDGDGRAILRSSVREFLASEAMYHLGIPTTRAAALVVSNDLVIRDIHYNGNIRKEHTAIVLRLAPSWFRIGSFELLARDGEIQLLQQLTDFVIENHFPELSASVHNRYASFFEAVLQRVASTTALWQSVGFAHGVLNTDNVSILGLTIDYGPFRFADEFDEDMVPNSSDDEHRYSYSRQPSVMDENLQHLLTALSRLMTAEEYIVAKNAMNQYRMVYWMEYMRAFRRKIGLSSVEMTDGDEALISKLLLIMADQRADFTATFRQLSDISSHALLKMMRGNMAHLPWALQQLAQHSGFGNWLAQYIQHLEQANVSDSVRRSVMQAANPHYVLRNWMAQLAIDKAENGDFSMIHSLQTILRRPFEKQSVAEYMGFSSHPPSWARNISISCAS